MIKNNVENILKEIPENVELVLAGKERTAEELLEAIDGGTKIIGENYLKDFKKVYPSINKKVKWHFIGWPEKEKHDLLRKKYLEMFDMIETINSFELAKEIDLKCKEINKKMEILIEVNSGREKQKSGVFPEEVENLILKISKLKNIKIMGLMTMGPRFGNSEDSLPYFKETKKIFDKIKSINIENVEMKYLSMGMTNSYNIAIKEGANLIRIGTKIFGERAKNKQ